MKIVKQITLTSAMAAATPLAAAHGPDVAVYSLIHYLSQPDHLLLFGLLALAAIGLLGLRRPRALKLKKD